MIEGDTTARHIQLVELVNSLQDDFVKFYGSSNKSAGTRIRKGMQELKKLAQEIRLEVQEIKNQS